MNGFFHGLSPAQHERMVMLAEEAAEVVQAVAKLLRHGPESWNPNAPEKGSNALQLQGEINDMLGVVSAMCKAGDPFALPLETEIESAWKRKIKYSHHQGIS